MKVLVACEFSGRVRDAFIEKGHDAWSCDLLPTESPGPHIQGDVLEILDNGWDLMIAHPPCTYLSYAGNAWWNSPGRKEQREQALKFFLDLYNSPIRKVCVENPHGYPRVAFRSPDQEIHPYYFGDREKKRTCLWLKKLLCLEHYEQDGLFGQKCTHTAVPEPSYITPDGRKQYFQAVVPSNKDRAHSRSRFWFGIANAMAEQWG